MYVKLFASLYHGTLRGCSDEILVFTNLLAHSDQYGIIDKHWRAIAEETGLSRDRVEIAILNLEAADPESRSSEMDGRRIVRVDEHRSWGWRIVNYGKYRDIKNEDDRREQNRLAQERFRNKNKQPSAQSNHSKQPSAQVEAEGDKEVDTEVKEKKPKSKTRQKKSQVIITQFLESCKAEDVKPLKADSPVYVYAESVGITDEMVNVCWQEFKARNVASGKQYTDWRLAFANCVRGNWLKLWWMKEGEPVGWTSLGEQARRAHA